MNEIHEKLISKAIEMYQEIRPCSVNLSLGDCSTREGNTIVFWFNTADESTHILTDIVF
jgi:hypothetical protein